MSGEDKLCVNDDDDMDNELRSTGAEFTFEEFVAMDNDVPTYRTLALEDIVAESRHEAVPVLGNTSDKDGSDDEEE